MLMMNNWGTNNQANQPWSYNQNPDHIEIGTWDPSSVPNKKTSTQNNYNSYSSPQYRDAYTQNYNHRPPQSFSNVQSSSSGGSTSTQTANYSYNYNPLSNYNPVMLPHNNDRQSMPKTNPLICYPDHEYRQPYSGVNHQTGPKQTLPYSKPASTNSLFSNPLNDSGGEQNDTNDDIRTEEQKLVDNMREASVKSDSDSGLRKPTRIAKSALAMLSKDLCEAALPFQSAETLKAFRDLSLGFSPETTSNSLVTSQKEDSLSSTNIESTEGDISTLSADAKEFVPSTTVSKQNTLTEDDAIKLTKSVIDELILDPASFDKSVPRFIETLKQHDLSDVSVGKFVDNIYESCITIPDFRYLGSQLCDLMSRPTSSLENFRRILLKKAKPEFDRLDTALRSDDDAIVTRARGLSLFMAELFLSLMIEDENGKHIRLTVLGKAVVTSVEKLVSLPNDENLMTAGKIIKLTILGLQESLQNNMEQCEKLDQLLTKLCSYKDDNTLNISTIRFLEGIVKQRMSNWGKTQLDSPAETETAESSTNYHTFMEPVFYTPDGKPYTVLDTLEQEFAYDGLESGDSTVGSHFDAIPITAEEADVKDLENDIDSPDNDEDINWSDYDDEFEQFLAQQTQ